MWLKPCLCFLKLPQLQAIFNSTETLIHAVQPRIDLMYVHLHGGDRPAQIAKLVFGAGHLELQARHFMLNLLQQSKISSFVISAMHHRSFNP
ncbi:hypothetical protein RHI9324_02779 [Rhizobium sp. CECT 9324]|nr:hypothetical protein RHI9324_02779 [Rhizobium sp. CECT 9324]